MSHNHSLMPPWFIFHIPHSSRVIPEWVRPQIILSDAELDIQLNRMTDHATLELFASDIPEAQRVVAPISRLIVDTERFRTQEAEPMEACGMGAIYEQTDDGRRLRETPSREEREELLQRYYDPHHTRLKRVTESVLEAYGQALIIDCHSYPLNALPYEQMPNGERPELCLGTDPFHTSASLTQATIDAFKAQGFEVGLNSPFAGTLVPLDYYQRDARVQSVMLELRRDMYVEESDTTVMKAAEFEQVAIRLRAGLVALSKSADCRR